MQKISNIFQVTNVLNKNKDELIKTRYKFPVGNLMSKTK